jgi:hypothetical protein
MTRLAPTLQRNPRTCPAAHRAVMAATTAMTTEAETVSVLYSSFPFMRMPAMPR